MADDEPDRPRPDHRDAAEGIRRSGAGGGRLADGHRLPPHRAERARPGGGVRHVEHPRDHPGGELPLVPRPRRAGAADVARQAHLQRQGPDGGLFLDADQPCDHDAGHAPRAQLPRRRPPRRPRSQGSLDLFWRAGAVTETLELFQRLGLAVAVGFLIGVERGWKSRDMEDETRVAGLRTYTLIGLLGGVAGLLGVMLGVAAFASMAIAFALMWTVFKVFETMRDGDISVTGTVAGLLVFALGAYAIVGDLAVVAASGVLLAGALAFKDAMHDWLDRLTWPELRSGLLILAATFVALPLLPDRALDPYGAFNPRELWLLTIVLALASFAGYVALRVGGRKAGVYFAAAAGALVSSTVVTLDLARRNKAGEVAPVRAAAAATLANIVMFIRVGVLIAVFATPAFIDAWPALAAAVAASAAAIALLAHATARRGEEDESTAPVTSPLDLKSVGRFALLLAAITVGARIVASVWGEGGLLAFAATAGLVDVDAVALAVGGMVRDGLAPHDGANAILLAAAVDTASKVAIAAFAGERALVWRYALASAAALVAGVGTYIAMTII
ncbi:MAG: DUF4010 domain-containing protein [Alphaproteobacteria bacterium]|nr:DUF4010 domain-containing protein [Alphaproteobacteria bacterium]